MKRARTAPELKILSLFTGAGGLDLGLEAAGFSVAGCVEFDADCRQTLQTNRPDWLLVEPGDILALDPADLLAQLGVKPTELALVAGGPPCQPFSKSSFWLTGEAPGMKDPRAETLRAYLRVIDEAQPQAMLLENVKGIGFVGKGRAAEKQALEFLEERLAEINERRGTSYRPCVLHLDAADYGVPQHRERVFVFASRDGQTLTEPAPTHGPHAAEGAPRLSTTWDALADVDVTADDELRPRGRWAELLATIPEGQNYQWHTPRGGGQPLFGWRTKYWSFLLKLAKNRPSWTIQAQPGPATGPFHWESRRLAVAEMAALQTFPAGYEITGSYGAGRRQLGNAVPAAMGELLGWEIHKLLDKTAAEALTLIPKQRSDCPEPEAPAAVPRRFLDLCADHAAHPGTGQGPGASKRAAVGDVPVSVHRAA